ncbi:MAG TPA: TolC family protein [Termitinemataceae bacterium]|jgi:outer membrane protein TolC|nr:TolC family protein [Termitinemataceae bacterium]HOM22504.1 TolC family protein [Termitinemataceae bacterium]HPQ00725.1 TolC family protein [Termitinemataceae bacterium]
MKKMLGLQKLWPFIKEDVVFLCFFLWTVPFSFGEAPAGTSERLNLTAARNQALARSLDLRKAQIAVDKANLSRSAALYNLFPSISGSLSGSWSYPESGSASSTLSSSARLSGSVTLFDGGSGKAKLDAATLAAQSAQESLRSTRLSVIEAVDTAFLDVLKAQAALDAKESSLVATKWRLQIAQVKAAVGALSKADLLSTEADMASAQASLFSAQKTLAAARAKLASLTGVPSTVPLVAVDFTQYDEVIGKLAALENQQLAALMNALVALARKQNPQLAVYQLSIGEARASLNSARSSWFPSVSAGVSQNFPLQGNSSNQITGSVSLSASWNLDFWVTRNSVEQAQKALSQAEIDRASQEQTLSLTIEQTLYEWISSALQISSSMKALEYAQANYDNVAEKFRLSSAAISDLASAEALLSSSKESLITAQYSFLTALFSLRNSVGVEEEEEILRLLKEIQ